MWTGLYQQRWSLPSQTWRIKPVMTKSGNFLSFLLSYSCFLIGIVLEVVNIHPPSIHSFIYLSIHPSIHPSMPPSTHLPPTTYLPTYPFIYQPTYLPSIHLLTHPFIHQPIHHVPTLHPVTHPSTQSFSIS